MFTWIGELLSDWFSGLTKFIGDLGIDDILSSIFGIIPRSIMFLRSLFMPIYKIIEGVFPSPMQFMGVNTTAFIFYALIGFIVMLGFRRGVTK